MPMILGSQMDHGRSLNDPLTTFLGIAAFTHIGRSAWKIVRSRLRTWRIRSGSSEFCQRLK